MDNSSNVGNVQVHKTWRSGAEACKEDVSRQTVTNYCLHALSFLSACKVPVRLAKEGQRWPLFKLKCVCLAVSLSSEKVSEK
jgi:hypothetical protein